MKDCTFERLPVQPARVAHLSISSQQPPEGGSFASETASFLHSRHDFGRIPIIGQGEARIPYAPSVSEPGDPDEREAARMADAALRDRSFMPPALLSPSETGRRGEPLPAAARSGYERRFGHDFGAVRIHAGAHASASAQSLNAMAYAFGNDIVFGHHAAKPGFPISPKIVAHELSHIPQQAKQAAEPGRVRRQPTSSPDSSRTESRPAPYRLELSNPFSDTSAHAAYYELMPALLGFGLEQTARRFPDLDRSLLYRLAEWSILGVGPEVPWMVYSHEAGHRGAGERFGWNPQITMTGWFSGETSRGIPPGVAPTPQQDIAFEAGGVNQEQINASRMYSRWALSGNMRYQEAMAYLLAQTNLAAYATRTISLSNPPSRDDIAAYVKDVPGMTTGKLLAVAALTDLLSGPAWAALIGQYRFIRHGGRRVSMPTLHVGGLRMTLPHWQMLLTSQGPLVGGRMILNPGGNLPVEVTLDTRWSEPGAAVGVRVHEIPVLTPDLRISPFLRATVADPIGIYTGVEVRYDLAPWVGVSGQLGFRKNDLLSEPEGRGDGVEGGAALNLRF